MSEPISFAFSGCGLFQTRDGRAKIIGFLEPIESRIFLRMDETLNIIIYLFCLLSLALFIDKKVGVVVAARATIGASWGNREQTIADRPRRLGSTY